LRMWIMRLDDGRPAHVKIISPYSAIGRWYSLSLDPSFGIDLLMHLEWRN
jgi:hypothetical protein